MTIYRSFQEILAEALEHDPELRAGWDKTQLAREVAIWLVQYRKEHGLTQSQLARDLGWQQPVVARLESGEREPSIATLRHLVERLGFSATIEIAPEQVHVRFIRRRRRHSGRPADGRSSTSHTRTAVPV
jgi:ribosome-binding protein aMBF1 (putative translation factor)